MPSVEGGLESLQEQWLCNATLQWQSTIVPNWDSGWGGYKKYNKFTHRLNQGVEHRQMHGRAPPPKQGESKELKKQEPHCNLKKFPKSFEKYSSCQQNKPKLG